MSFGILTPNKVCSSNVAGDTTGEAGSYSVGKTHLDSQAEDLDGGHFSLSVSCALSEHSKIQL